MPGGDLGVPADDGAAELVDLGRAVVVLEIVAEAQHVLVGEAGVDVVDASDGLFGVPCGADLSVRVTGV